MADPCPLRDETTAAEHCWHDTGVVLTSHPPIVVERCCYCGTERHLRMAVVVPRGDHGPYAPSLIGHLTVSSGTGSSGAAPSGGRTA